jgi:hypothetical protein
MLASRASAARDFERTPTSAVGSYTNARGEEAEINFRDLAQGGCQVHDPAGGMKLGAKVALIIEGTGPINAEVAWRDGEDAGLEFINLLPEQVFRHLIAQEWELARNAPLEERQVYTVRRMM